MPQCNTVFVHCNSLKCPITDHIAKCPDSLALVQTTQRCPIEVFVWNRRVDPLRPYPKDPLFSICCLYLLDTPTDSPQQKPNSAQVEPASGRRGSSWQRRRCLVQRSCTTLAAGGCSSEVLPNWVVYSRLAFFLGGRFSPEFWKCVEVVSGKW